MPLRALITRPQEDTAALAQALEVRGVSVLLEPLLTIALHPDVRIELDGAQALLFTSANGVRAFAQASARRDLPAFAVGEATAAAAREVGFARVESASGDVQALADLVVDRLKPAGGALVHIAGSAVAGDLAASLGGRGFDLRRAVVYEARPAEALSATTQQALAAGSVDMVLFFSPRTAEIFARLVREAPGAPSAGDGSTAEKLVAGCANADALCLSETVAAAARQIAWRAVRTAEKPTLEAMLALVDAVLAGAHAEEKVSPVTKTAPPRMPPTAEETSERQPPPPIPAAAAGRRGASAVGATLLAAVVAILVAAGTVISEPWWRPYLAAAIGSGGAAPQADGGSAEDLAALSERAGRAETSLGGLEARLAQSETALDTLRHKVDALAAEPAGADSAAASPTAPAPLPPEIAALPDRFAALEHRLQELSAAAQSPAASATAAAVSPEDLARLRAETTALRDQIAASQQELQRLSALGERVAGLDAALRRDAAVSTAAALSLAAGRLQAAVDGGGTYAAELAAVRGLGAEDPALAAQIETAASVLQARADRGVPTLAQLRDELGKLADALARLDTRQAIAEAVGVSEQSWLDRVVGKAAELVTVRPVGDDIRGDTPAAHAGRAEARLAVGDLAGAVAEMAPLTGEAAALAAPWLERAGARLAAEQALTALQRAAVSGKQPAASGETQDEAAPASGG